MDQHERFTLHWTAAQSVVGSYIGSLVPDFQEAEDLLQEVALVLLRKFAEYDERRPFVAWALGVAKFEILSSRRRHARSFLTAQSDVLEKLMIAYIDSALELDRHVADSRNHTIRKGYPALAITSSGRNFGFNGGQFRFNLTGPSGRLVVVEASSDLVSWLPLWTNTFSDALNFNDPQSGPYSNRFLPRAAAVAGG